MKTIGIILRDYKSENNNSLQAFRDDLLIFLRQYEINVIAIPICFYNNVYEELKRVEESISLCDGIILPGGSELHEIDLKIVNYLYEKDLPTLGICLGMQEMSMAFDGKIDYLENTFHQSSNKYVHDINIKKDSKLFSILKKDNIPVNSRHKEHILKTNLSITAVSEDLVIEGVEAKSKRFFIGVQWHPESILHDYYSKQLFDAFIDSI